MTRPVRYQLTDRCLDAIQRERAAGTTQKEIAAWVGMPPVTLSRWIHSRPEDPLRPDDQRMARLAAVLDLAVADCWEEVE